MPLRSMRLYVLASASGMEPPWTHDSVHEACVRYKNLCILTRPYAENPKLLQQISNSHLTAFPRLNSLPVSGGRGIPA